MTTSSNVADRLEAAAGLLARDGWFRTDLYGGVNTTEGNGSRCALTAIYATEIGGYLGDAGDEARRALARFVGDERIPAWNNAADQTKENVIATMRACAAIWRAKHEPAKEPAKEVVNA